MIVARWHRPSDVFAAICVVTVFALLLSPLELGDERGQRALRRGRILTLLAAVVALLGAVIVGYCYFRLGSGQGYFTMGTVTSDLSRLAASRHPLALALSAGTVLALMGACWVFVFEVARAGLRPVKNPSSAA